MKSALNNPFATRHVAPGQIPYFFADEGDLQQIIKRADEAAWTGQIVGPHGSGKTTLIRHLSSHLRQRFTAVEFVIVRSAREVQFCPPKQIVLQSRETAPPTIGKAPLLYVIDGVERLSWLQRRLLIADCRRKSIGLLVTAHRQLLGLPVFFKTSFNQKQFLKILRQLGTQQYNEHFQRLSNEFGENCREMLFELYDEHLRSDLS